MSTVLRGLATVFGVKDGSIDIAGAGAFTPKYKAHDFSHDYDKKPITDGEGKVLGYAAVDGLIKGKLTWTITEANIAAAEALLVFHDKLAAVTLAGFPMTELNHERWICTSAKPVFAQGDHATYELEIECSEDDAINLAAAIS